MAHPLTTGISVTEFALFGGSPCFDTPRHVNRPNAAPRTAFDNYFDEAWKTKRFSNGGPLLVRFEQRLSEYLDVADAVVVCNATIGLSLAIQALGLTGEIILPSYTFISSANAIKAAGLTPVFCDIRPHDMNMDPDACAALITPRTSAVLATHAWGEPCDTDALAAVCDTAGITLLYDAAHAFGVLHQGRKIGGFGRAEIFSLHATKVLHAFEGGVIATDDTKLADALRLRRNFGFTGVDQVEIAGLNAKMSEAHAAMGLANLDIIDEIIAANRRRHDAYAKGLSGLPGVQLNRPAAGATSNYHYVVADIDAAAFGLTRDALVDLLFAENVLARRYFHPGGHRSLPHLPEVGGPPSLPVTEAICERVLVLPAGAAIELQDVAAICDLIRRIAASAPEISARLS